MFEFERWKIHQYVQSSKNDDEQADEIHQQHEIQKVHEQNSPKEKRGQVIP